MSLTVLTPTSGGLFGPGFTVTVETDIIGPLEPGSFWMFELSAPAGEEVMTRKFLGFIANQTSTILHIGTNTTAFLTEARPEWTSGAGGRLRIELNEPSSGIVDSINVPVVIDRQAGQNQELAAWFQANQTSSGAGLTEAEHNAVLQTNVGVIAMAGFSPIDLVGDIVQSIGSLNPLGYGSLSTPAECITGDGELADEEPLLPKWGLYWVATTIPAGLGHRHGQSEEYPSRLVQWRTVHEVGGVEMVTEVIDAQTHGELWRFRQQRPRRVEYSVLPGVTICAQWWQFP